MNGTPVPPRVNDLRRQHSSSFDFIPQYPQERMLPLAVPHRQAQRHRQHKQILLDAIYQLLPQLRFGSSTLIRDNSVRSYGFSSAGPSAVQYVGTYNDPANGYRIHGGSPMVDQDDEDDDYFTDSDDPDPDRFVNFSLLSHLAVRLRDKVPRGTHVKSSIPHPHTFTGKDIAQIQRELLMNHGVSTADRRAALQVARSLQSQLFFYEVEWGDKPLQDGVENVYMFLDDLEGDSESHREREELPTAITTMLTKCYVSSCSEDDPCSSCACPRRRITLVADISSISEPEIAPHTEDCPCTVDPTILHSLPDSNIHWQIYIVSIVLSIIPVHF
ncbi:hypothetical protein PAXINDRAFT_96028, partial [Paxillus involutus ATCC 200175]